MFLKPLHPQTKTNMEPKHQGFGFMMILLLLPVVGRSCPVPPWGRSSPARGATLMRMLMCWHPGATFEEVRDLFEDHVSNEKNPVV